MEEFKVKLAPKIAGKKLSVFRMHKDDHVPWAEAKMKRENEYKPWLIKTGKGQASKRYKANRVGNVDENSDYFIFYRPKGSKDTYEVCPVNEWYNVAADKRYTTLTAEQAEELYLKHEKTYNPAALMKRDNEDGVSASDSKSFKISEMDDWGGSDDDFSGSDNDDLNGEDAGAKKKSKKKSLKKEKGDDEVPEEGKEDSDEGDFEQREVDYMSETSSESGESEKGGDREDGDVKGIDEEQALRDLLDSEEEEEEDAGGSPEKGMKPNSTKSPTQVKQDPDGNGSDASSDNDDDSDDYDVDEEAMDSMFMRKSLPAELVKQEPKQKPDVPSTSANTGQVSSSSQKTPSSGSSQQPSTANKRKLADSAAAAGTPGSSSATIPPTKRPCPPDSQSSSLPNSIERTIEDLIKKYLRRKPTTTKTLLKDIRTKLKRMGGTDLDFKRHIHFIADIIKRLNPEKQKLNDETYFFLKS